MGISTANSELREHSSATERTQWLGARRGLESDAVVKVIHRVCQPKKDSQDMDEYESRGSKFMDLEQNSGIRCGVVEGQLVSLWQYFGCFWRRQQGHSVEGAPKGGLG